MQHHIGDTQVVKHTAGTFSVLRYTGDGYWQVVSFHLTRRQAESAARKARSRAVKTR